MSFKAALHDKICTLINESTQKDLIVSVSGEGITLKFDLRYGASPLT